MGEEFDKFCSFINLYTAYRKARKRGLTLPRLPHIIPAIQK